MKAKRIDLVVKIEVANDPFEAAVTIAKVGEPWKALIEALKASGVKFEARHDTVANRGTTAPMAPTTRRTRRQQAAQSPQPQLPVAEDEVPV